MRTLKIVPVVAALSVSPAALLAQPEPPPMPPPRPEPEHRHDHRQPPMISVTGRAEVAARPDLAVVRLGATVQAETAAEAHGRVSQIMAAAIEQIRALGIPEEDISTASLNIFPVYSQPRPREETFEPRIIGYRASSTIRIELTNLDAVGGVIDTAIAAGANQFEGLSFELRDDSAIRMRALRQASQQARAKAEAIASALDVRLEGLQEAAEANAGVVYPQMQRFAGREMLAMDAAATPVQPGQVRVEAVVTLSYRVSPGGEAGPGRE